MVSVYYRKGATDDTLFKLIFSVLKRRLYKQLYWQKAWLIKLGGANRWPAKLHLCNLTQFLLRKTCPLTAQYVLLEMLETQT